MERQAIIFDVGSVNGWIGGVYYIKNIIFSLLQSKKITEKYYVLLFLDKKYENVFTVFGNSIQRCIYEGDTKRSRYKEFKKGIEKIKCKYIYNYQISQYGIYEKNKAIFWIADFQHKHYPMFFKRTELIVRDIKYKILSKHKNMLVLSSEDALKDFKTFFGPYRVDAHVVHFVSYIEEELKAIDSDFEKQTLEKYNLSKFKYIYIPNQFWQHKNHIVVLKAIQKMERDNHLKEYKFVFTGELKDYRNPSYYATLREMFDDEKIKKNVLNLGFLDRKEQLAIMKNAKVIVQPSLFEGWGTVLEDAKVLDKFVILSDIPVHKEQKNDRCILFNPNDDEQLASLIKERLEAEYTDDINKGIQNMYKDAREYANELEKIFK